MDEPLIILDGSMGQELMQRGAGRATGLWSAQALLDAPEIVAQVHRDYIDAGARVITTNSYSTIPSYLGKEGLAERYVELTGIAGRIAREVADAAEVAVQVAGSIPPLDESYRWDLVPDAQSAAPIYTNVVETLAPYVDLFLCETMSCAQEAVNALTAVRAGAPDKPVWVSWTLAEKPGEGLRSHESIADAYAAIAEFEVDAYLFNCTDPKAISAALVELRQLTEKPIGAYPNRFNVPENWTLDNEIKTEYRELSEAEFVDFARDWRQTGASIIGGCCGIGPSYIRALAAA